MQPINAETPIPMAVSDDLYQLISSLSMSEKRYLRIFSTRHVKGEKNIYLQLFDTIIALREPDDDAVKAALEDSDIRQKLNKHKHYLYNLILRSLNAYHADHSGEARFRETMRSVEILYQRGLFDQSRKVLRKARRMAEELQRIPELLAVSDWEQNLLSKSSQYGRMAELVERDEVLVDELRHEKQAKLLVFRMYDRLLQFGAAPDTQDLAELKRMMDDPVISLHTNQRFHVRYLISMANIVCANAMDDKDSFLHHCDETVRIFEENPVFITERPNLFVSALLNQCKANLQCDRLDEVSRVLDRIRAFQSASEVRMQKHTIANIVYETTHIDLLCSLKQSDLKKADRIIRESEADLERYLPTVTRSLALSLRFDAAYAYFLLGMTDRCLVWLNRLLNDQEYHIRMQLHAVARLFSMVVHLQLGNDSLVEYTARSIKLELRKWDFAKATASALVRFFSVYTQADEPAKQRRLTEALMSDLTQIRNEGTERDVYNLFDFSMWAESLLEQKPMVALIGKDKSVP